MKVKIKSWSIMTLIFSDGDVDRFLFSLAAKFEASKSLFVGSGVVLEIDCDVDLYNFNKLFDGISELGVRVVGVVGRFSDSWMQGVSAIRMRSHGVEAAAQASLLGFDVYWGDVNPGAILTYQNSVIVVGDVYASAIIKARGNVIVLGKVFGDIEISGVTNESFVYASAISQSKVLFSGFPVNQSSYKMVYRAALFRIVANAVEVSGSAETPSYKRSLPWYDRLIQLLLR